MGKRGPIKYQLTESCTRRGCHSFVPRLIQDIARVWILKSPDPNRQTEFIKQLGENLASRGYEVEFWLSAMQPGGAEGVFFPQLDAAVVSGCLVHPLSGPDERVELIDLGAARGRIMDDAREEELAVWQARLLHHKRLAEDLIENSLYMEEYLEQQVLVDSMDASLDILSKEVQRMLFARQPGEKHFYATALTLDGLMDYVTEVTGHCRTRYILHGPPGCGQSRVLEQTSLEALNRGWEVNYYHWALDPERVCLVLIPALNSALLDDSCLDISPRAGDMVVDMSHLITKPEDRSNEQQNRLNKLLLQVKADLNQVDRARREINRLQPDGLGTAQLDEQREKLEREIVQY